MPDASNSSCRYPSPTPSWNPPLVIASIAAACSATSSGLSSGRRITDVPSVRPGTAAEQAREERERLEELVVAGEEVLARPERLEARRGSGLDEARVGPNGLRRRKVGGRLGELDA